MNVKWKNEKPFSFIPKAATREKTWNWRFLSFVFVLFVRSLHLTLIHGMSINGMGEKGERMESFSFFFCRDFSICSDCDFLHATRSMWTNRFVKFSRSHFKLLDYLIYLFLSARLLALLCSSNIAVSIKHFATINQSHFSSALTRPYSLSLSLSQIKYLNSGFESQNCANRWESRSRSDRRSDNFDYLNLIWNWIFLSNEKCHLFSFVVSSESPGEMAREGRTNITQFQ